MTVKYHVVFISIVSIEDELAELMSRLASLLITLLVEKFEEFNLCI